MAAGGVLGLDLSTRCGYAAADLHALQAWPRSPVWTAVAGPWPKLESGVWSLASPDRGITFHRFWENVTGLIRRNGVTVVFYEAPLPAKQQKSMDAAQIALGLEALTLAACRECGVRLAKPVHNSTVKKHFAGTGRADKLAIIEVCRRRGWSVEDDNHADALAVADLGIWETWLNRGAAA